MKRYDHNGVLIKDLSDDNTSKEARQARWTEYVGLKSLPFLSGPQLLRLTELRKLCTRDNKITFKESKNSQATS